MGTVFVDLQIFWKNTLYPSLARKFRSTQPANQIAKAAKQLCLPALETAGMFSATMAQILEGWQVRTICIPLMIEPNHKHGILCQSVGWTEIEEIDAFWIKYHCCSKLLGFFYCYVKSSRNWNRIRDILLLKYFVSTWFPQQKHFESRFDF